MRITVLWVSISAWDPPAARTISLTYLPHNYLFRMYSIWEECSLQLSCRTQCGWLWECAPHCRICCETLLHWTSFLRLCKALVNNIDQYLIHQLYTFTCSRVISFDKKLNMGNLGLLYSIIYYLRRNYFKIRHY